MQCPNLYFVIQHLYIYKLCYTVLNTVVGAVETFF